MSRSRTSDARSTISFSARRSFRVLPRGKNWSKTRRHCASRRMATRKSWTAPSPPDFDARLTSYASLRNRVAVSSAA